MNDLQKISVNCAGIDIGSKEVFVATEDGKVKSFGTYSSSYRDLAAYLKDYRVTHVAMEATGVYWITLFDVLESHGFDVTLVNPADSKNLPGRKTDVQDCQWIQKLFSYGLLRKSFVPDKDIRELRVFTRMREDRLQIGSTYLQHIRKALIQMNLRITEVLSQTSGVSSLNMIRAILDGERNPEKLLSLCDRQVIKKKANDILLALEGNYKPEYMFELRQAYESYVFNQKLIDECDKEIDRKLSEIEKQRGKDYKDEIKPKVIRHNRPKVDNLHEKMLKLYGCNPTLIPGITDYTAMKLIAEIGTDISQWKNVKSFVSWAGLAPGKNQSGKSNRRSKKRPVTRVGQFFKIAGQSVLEGRYSALSAFAKKIRARKGSAVAIKATARKIAEMFYRTMANGIHYVEQGIAKYEAKCTTQNINYLTKMAKKYNLQVVHI